MKEEEKCLTFKLSLRVYGRGLSTSNSHGYLVDDTPTGVTTSIAELNLNIRTMNLKKLRPILEYDQSMNYMRRSMIFQEVLFVMSRLPNYFDRPNNELNKYSFGFYRKDGKEFRLIDSSLEDKPIADLIGATEFFSFDLVIVPWSQIPPLDIRI